MNLGEKGEHLAKKYLEKKGYTILAENFRTRFGEIDLITEYKGEIIFVEVKTRSRAAWGLPCEAVGKAKQKKIRSIANYYLLISGNTGSPCRMDIIEILIIDSRPFLRQITDAF